MAGSAFIRFEKTDGGVAPGESQQTGHPGSGGWIDIGRWSWTVEAEASHLKGTGSAVGKPVPGAVSFSHFYDKSSPVLLQFIVRGIHFKTVTIDLLKQTGKEQPELFFQMICKDVFITKVNQSGGDDGAVSQDIEFIFKQMAIGYKRQNNDGTLAAAQFFRWNVAAEDQNTPDIRMTIQ